MPGCLNVSTSERVARVSRATDFDRERALFTLCVERPSAEWEQVLESQCDDPGLRERVRRLLERHRDTPTHDSGFLRLDGGDPDRIGPYRILQRLGEGGMGIVYAAEQREPMRRRVAIKVLRGGYSSREVLARFDVERQALALMNHANIARILDAGTTADHRPFIVMEFVPGEPVTRYCEQRNLSLRARLSLLRTVCDAVQHAHQKGVIHRDLKPSNILVMEEDGKPVPKIIDFGIAKAVSQRLTERTLETKVGSLLGTPDYMSPEQAELSPLDVDTRSDVYALGAVMYRVLTGVPPLRLSGSGKSYTDIQRTILDEIPAAPSQKASGLLRRQLRGELDWIVLKALEKQRADRYASAADLAADIRRHLNNETVSAGPPSRLRKIDKFVRRHWLATASALAVIVTLSVSQLLLVQKNRELEAERDRANVAAATSESVTAF
ncbi:MAG TPA: serine/threonine-protein kinase, partial [Gammaproteobacteria bacterium]